MFFIGKALTYIGFSFCSFFSTFVNIIDTMAGHTTAGYFSLTFSFCFVIFTHRLMRLYV